MQKGAALHHILLFPVLTIRVVKKPEVPVSTANNNSSDNISLNAFKQPKAFYLIFSIELWERFGYYGLQGIMAVYLVKMLGLSEADSITLFSSFSALVYGFVAIGGWLGDKVGLVEKVFGFWGGIVFCLILALVGLVIVFEWSLKIKKEEKKWLQQIQSQIC